jgi:dTDP-4-amino-4,6-dideoxygalactose transaminase
MIPLHKVFVPENLDAMMADLRGVIASGWVGEGPKVLAFEQALRAVVGHDSVTALNAGTSSLQLALRLAGVEAGDEVISTPMTCMATNLPIVLAGATPVWADVDPTTGNISPASIESRLTPRTKAIMIVHWGGYPCDIAEINAIARKAGVKVIEDAAHALGSTYHDKPIGCHSDFVCFSFQAIKHIHTGDGGLLSCRSMVDHARSRSLKWFGIDRERRQVNEYGIAEWDIVEAGYKFHMNDIAATLGLAQLPYLDSIVAARQSNARKFREAFCGLKRLQLPIEKLDRLSAYWLFTVLVDDQVGFIRYLNSKGIAASIVHSRNDRMKVLARYERRELPGLDKFASSMVCIPVGQWVDEAARGRIIDAVTSEAW